MTNIKYNQMIELVPGIINQNIQWSLLLDIFPDLLKLASTPQDPVHHAEGDVLTHTKMVCEELINSIDYHSADDDRKFVLFFSALFHDIAKPACTRTENNRIISPGHSKRGAIDIRIALWRANVPFDLRERICNIINNHQVPFFAINGNRAGETAEYIVHRLSFQMPIIELAAVAEADIRGRTCSDSQKILDDIELFREIARDENCFTQCKQFPDSRTQVMYFRRGGEIPANYPFFAESKSKVIVLSGLPATGKNTWVNNNVKSYPVISFDDAREELGLKHGAANVGAAVHLATDRAKQLLRDSQPFVWNATHLSPMMRAKTLDLLYAYDAEVELVYLESPESVIKSRNNKRDTTLKNSDIDNMLFKWEVPFKTEADSVRYEIS